LFGRDDVVAAVIRHVEESPIVTLVGDGGMGKSRVAERVVEHLSATGWRISIVDLAAAEGSPEASPSDALDQSAAGLSLVWIDNALEATPFALELIARLRKVPAGRVLVTSRCTMGVAGERVIRVGPIADARAAARLFVHAASAAGSTTRFDTTPHTADIDAICSELDRWPLAIEMAARRTAVQSPAELLASLRTHTLSSILDGEHADGCTPTIAGVVTATIATLNDEPRQAAERLAALADWWTIEEGTELLPTRALDVVSALAARHVVEVGDSETSTVFRVRRPYREQLAGEHPAVSPVGSLARFAHGAVEGLLDGSTRGGDVRHWYLAIERRRHDLRAAAEAAEYLDPQAAAVITLALSMHAAERGNLAADGGLLDRVLVAIDRGGPVTPSLAAMLRGYKLHRRVEAVDPTTDTARLAAELGAAVAQAIDLGDPRVALMLLAHSVRSARTIGHIDQAARHADRALAIAESAELPAARATFELLAAMIAHVQRRFELAAMLASRAHMRARRLDLPLIVAQASLMFRQLPPGTPNLPPVLPSLREVLDLLDTSNRFRSSLGVAFGIAVEAMTAGDLATAARAAAFGTRTADSIGLPAAAGTGIMVLVAIAASAGEPELATRMHGALADQREVVLRSAAPGQRVFYDRFVDLAHKQLGDEDYARALECGAARSWPSIVAEALHFADGLAGCDVVVAAPSPEESSLTPRELEVLHLLASGSSNKEIAVQLGMAPKTTMHHTSKIYRKLGVRSRGEAAAWARRVGIV
jgi:DNA-binding CsgD family transcriptional regulator